MKETPQRWKQHRIDGLTLSGGRPCQAQRSLGLANGRRQVGSTFQECAKQLFIAELLAELARLSEQHRGRGMFARVSFDMAKPRGGLGNFPPGTEFARGDDARLQLEPS